MKIRRRERIGVLAAAVLALFVISLPGIASAKDRNKDKIPDRWERSHKLSLKRDQRKLDQDKDGLRNRGEWRAGTNPRDKDSDNDGVSDLKEKAGVISAYDADTGDLTITLYSGGELTGSVTDQTRVRCESEDTSDDSSDDSSDDGTGDDSGDESGETERSRGGPGSGREAEDDSGDDSGDQSEDESGDDQGGHPGRGGEGCGGDCSVEDLAKGVEVTEAVVKYTASGKVFKELEIVVSTDE
jgi:hypothetical protein